MYLMHTKFSHWFLITTPWVWGTERLNGHIASKWRTRDSNPGIFEACLLTSTLLLWYIPLGQRFSTLAMLTFWAKWFFTVGSCPLHCRMFSISGLYPLDAKAFPLMTIVTIKISPDIIKSFPGSGGRRGREWGTENITWLRNTILRKGMFGGFWDSWK